MSFPPGFLDELRARISLADVVGRRVSYDPKKSNPRRRDFWACCPFHSEKTPSFHVEDAKGFYHCFGCGASGDAIKFVEMTENVGFAEAVERLAEEAGLPVPKQDPRDAARRDERKSIQSVLQAAQRVFAQSLRGPQGREARTYLEARDCGAPLWDTFGIGLAPGGRGALRAELAKEKISTEQLLEAGLLGRSDSEIYERFRDRIMFPIHDGRGGLVGFGGRLLAEQDNAPKYLNSPETTLFQKGRLLFNLPAARKASRETGTLILAEGYMDVIALHRAGLAHAVAPLGTALTEHQLALLWQVTPEPILCFDGDEAGRRAAYRAADLALPRLKPGYSLRFALLPDGQDPDDLIRAHGAGAIRSYIDDPEPLVALLWHRELSQIALDRPEQVAALEQRLAALARSIEDRSVSQNYLRAFGERLQALREGREREQRVQRFRARGASSGLRNTPLARASKRPATPIPPAFFEDLEAGLLAALTENPLLLERVGEGLSEVHFSLPALDRLSNELIDLCSIGTSLDSTALKGHLKEHGLLKAVEPLFAREIVRRMRGSWLNLGLDEAEHQWRHAAGRLARARQLRKDIEQATAALGEGEDETVMRRFAALVAEWQKLKSEGPQSQLGEGGV